MIRNLSVALLFLAACGIEQGDLNRSGVEADGPEFADQTVSGLRGDDGDDGIIIGNALATQSLVINTLTTSRAANAALTRTALNRFASVPQLNEALNDPRSVELMKYLVGCALAKTSTVSWTSRAGAVETFKGQAGLCPAWEALAEGAVVSASCQQLVSACILARNNALGYRVPISVRGDDLVSGTRVKAGHHFNAFDFRERVLPVQSLQTSCPTPPRPTAPRPAAPRQVGARRNCGWEAGLVHTCVPGATVTVAAGAPAATACATGTPLGAVTSGHMVLRACKGFSGCDFPEVLGQSEGYECSNYRYKPTITFVCPGDGQFNVMSAPYVSGSFGTVSLGTLGAAPASEPTFFSVREGAFYGNLFDPASLTYEVSSDFDPQTNTRTITPPPATGKEVVFQSMYSCADDQWVDSTYIREGRVCALGNCAAHFTGRCSAPTGARCSIDTAGDGEFRQCMGDGLLWPRGLTTFLRDRCDLTDPAKPKRCARPN